MTTAYIGLGSNEGDRIGHMATALEAISQIPETHVSAASHVYGTEPAYVEDQPQFANAVLEVETDLTVEVFLENLQSIESDMGRVRTVENGPRVIDLDILLFGDDEVHSDEITVPHPGILERDFVVTPLLQIAPRVHLPNGTRVSHDGATIGRVIDDLGPIPDLGRLTNEPVLAPEWVPVTQSGGDVDLVPGFEARLQFQREALEEAGIPFAWDPFEPEANIDPFGLPMTFKLLVPVGDAARASQLLADLDAAEPIFPAELTGEE